MILTGERMILNRMKKETEIEHLCRYEYAMQFVGGKKVLDAACGSGYGTKMLAQKAMNVIGMDISQEAIEYAKQNYKKDNSEYFVGSVEKLPFKDNEFDVVVSFETIEHVDERIQKAFLNEIQRVLKNDGMLIMSTPNKKIYTDERTGGVMSEYHIKEFYEDEFKRFLASKFKYVKFNQQFYAKTACIIEQEKSFANISGFDGDGMYIVALASNIDIGGKIDNSFLCRYPQVYEEYNDYVQVFYTNDGEINEEDSQIVEFNNKLKHHKMCIFLDGIKCTKLRIDPTSEGGIVKINSIEIGFENDQKEYISEYHTNAIRKEENILECIDEDLQLFIDLSNERKVQYVDIEFEVIEDMETFSTRRLKLLKEQNILLNEQVVCLKNEIKAIKESKTWKIMEKMTKIIHR